MKHQYVCPSCGYVREGLLDHQAIGIGSYSTTCPECNSHYDSYEVGSLEEAIEFEKKRNYKYENNG